MSAGWRGLPFAVLLVVVEAVGEHRAQNRENPLGQVITLLDGLAVKILADGEAEAKAYKEYVEWCDDVAANGAFTIKTAKAQKEKLEAVIEKSTTCIEGSEGSIAELAASVAQIDGDLGNATAIREKEHADFSGAEAELVESVSTLERAIAIMERHLAKNPSLAQVDTANTKALVHSLGAVIEAAGFPVSDRRRLLALVQGRSGAEAGGEDSAAVEADEAVLGAPDPAAYRSHSSSIVDVLEDLLDKAKAELSELRKVETTAQHNFNVLKQSLEDQKAADEKDMNEERATKNDCAAAKATAEGDLTVTGKDLANAQEAQATAQTECMTVAADHEATVKSRAEELEVIAKAKKILSTSTTGAEAQTYSFLQTVQDSGLKTQADLANAEVVLLIKRLARQYHSTALAQLASKVSAVVRYGAEGGEDPFVKVRELITDLIKRLMEEAAGEANEKAYCDEEMAKTTAKKADLQSTVDRLSAKLDKAMAASADLKATVGELQRELAKLAKEQAEMDNIRSEQRAAYTAAKSDLEQGLQGVRKALQVLREYYGGGDSMLQGTASGGELLEQPAPPEKHEKAGGAGGGIIGMLEVVESDFAKNLAEEETTEADAQSEYETKTQENKITKSLKDQDVKYRTKEIKSLAKSVSDLKSDRDSAEQELAAVLEYDEKLKERCVLKAESYEERKKRREAEIAGLKEALSILEGEAMLQTSRGPLRRAAGAVLLARGR